MLVSFSHLVVFSLAFFIWDSTYSREMKNTEKDRGQTWCLVSALLLISCMPSGKLLNLSERL